MIITAESFQISNGSLTIYFNSGKPYKSCADINTKIPSFIPELFTVLSVVTPGSPLWIKRQFGLEGEHQLKFNFPVSQEALQLASDLGKLSGFDLKAFSNKIIDRSDNYNLQDGWQVGYSGGKDSGLTTCILMELDQKIGLSSSIHEKTIYYPDLPIRRFKIHPWQNSLISVIACHAIANYNDKMVFGSSMIVQWPKSNKYISESNVFFKTLNKYLNKISGLTVTSILPQLMNQSIIKLLNERYPTFKRTFTPKNVSGYERLTYLINGYDLPKQCAWKNPLKNMSFKTGIQAPVAYLEIEHIFSMMKGHRLFRNNPLQNGRTWDWMDKYLVKDPSPIAKPEGLESIYNDHFDIYEQPILDTLASIINKFFMDNFKFLVESDDC